MKKNDHADLNAWATEAALYFAGYSDGRYDHFSQLGYIYPLDRLRLGDNGNALIIGTAGVDGLEFAYRKGSAAIWVFYPLDLEWREIAPDIVTFDLGWIGGSIKV